jgi:carbon monoxide dehydrogenase subunit G
MIHLEGQRSFAQPAGLVYARLTDLPFLVQCVPDVKEAKSVQAEEAELVVRPGFSFVRSDMHLTIKKLSEQPETQARYAFHSRGVGTSSEVEASFQLSSDGSEGTVVAWSADVKNVGGLLKAAPQGLLKAAAQKVIDEMLEGLENRLAATPS